MSEDSLDVVLLDLDLNTVIPSPRVENADSLFKKIINQKESERQYTRARKTTNNKVCDQVLKNLYEKLETGPKKQKLEFREEKRVKDLIKQCQEQRHVRSIQSFDLYKRRAFSAKPSSRQNFPNHRNRPYSASKPQQKCQKKRIQSSKPSCGSNINQQLQKPSLNRYIPKGRFLRKQKQAGLLTRNSQRYESQTKETMDSYLIFQKENREQKKVPKKHKKSGVKLKVQFENGIKKIIEDCHNSKSQLEKLNEQVNLFENFCKKAILYTPLRPKKLKNR